MSNILAVFAICALSFVAGRALEIRRREDIARDIKEAITQDLDDVGAESLYDSARIAESHMKKEEWQEAAVVLNASIQGSSSLWCYLRETHNYEGPKTEKQFQRNRDLLWAAMRKVSPEKLDRIKAANELARQQGKALADVVTAGGNIGSSSNTNAKFMPGGLYNPTIPPADGGIL